MTTEPEASFSVAYPCDLHCVVEVDLSDIHPKFTINQARRKADADHDELHNPKPPKSAPVGTPIHDGLKATFRSPATY